MFLVHDEPTTWIPPSLKFPPSQPPNSNPNNPTFVFSPPDFPIINISSSTISDTNSDISVLYSISQFNNLSVETPDEFADSEPSPSNYSQTNSSVFQNPLFNQSHQIIHSHPFPLLLMLRK